MIAFYYIIAGKLPPWCKGDSHPPSSSCILFHTLLSPILLFYHLSPPFILFHPISSFTLLTYAHPSSFMFFLLSQTVSSCSIPFHYLSSFFNQIYLPSSSFFLFILFILFDHLQSSFILIISQYPFLSSSFIIFYPCFILVYPLSSSLSSPSSY